MIIKENRWLKLAGLTESRHDDYPLSTQIEDTMSPSDLGRYHGAMRKEPLLQQDTDYMQSHGRMGGTVARSFYTYDEAQYLLNIMKVYDQRGVNHFQYRLDQVPVSNDARVDREIVFEILHQLETDGAIEDAYDFQPGFLSEIEREQAQMPMLQQMVLNPPGKR